MAYFDCIVGGSGKGNTLVVTCADELAGATITCTNGTKTYTKTCPSTSPYEVTFYGLMAGTWTVSATVSGNTYTTTVVVVDCVALLGGFNWRTWVDTAQFLDSSDYDSLDEVLADELAVRELCLEHACVDYMADITTANEDVETIINNDLFAKWVNNSDYSLDVLGANVIIKALMDTADKYGYGEWCLMPQVPTMTSNTAPSGVVARSSISASTYEAYKAFDNDASTRWSSADNEGQGAWISYDFGKVTKVNKVTIYPFFSNGTMLMLKGYKIQGSNDNFASDIHDLYSDELDNVDVGKFTIDISVSEYRYYRLYATTDSYYTTKCISINELQFYAWAPKGNVPVMTANNAPYGEASAANAASNYPAWKAFDGDESSGFANGRAAQKTDYLQYTFTNPVCAKRVYIQNQSGVHNVLLKASNDGTNFVELATITFSSIAERKFVDLNNDTYYLTYRLYCNEVQSTEWWSISSLQFYGRELKSIVPIMTGYTTPYGTVTTSSDNDSAAWRGFRGISDAQSDRAVWSTSEALPQYAMYESPSKRVLKAFKYENNYDGATTRSNTFELLISNDGTTFDNLGTFSNQSTANYGKSYYDLSANNNEAKYFKINGLTKVGGYFPMANIQFYGLDYSEKEFEEGTTKKWIYDHGVELDNNGFLNACSSRNKITVFDDNIKLEKIDTTSSAADYVYSVTKNSIDFTNYTRVFLRVDAFVVGNCQWNVPMLLTSNNITSNPGNGPAYTRVTNAGPISFLDVSSISQSLYVCIGTGYNDGTGVTRTYELWLE